MAIDGLSRIPWERIIIRPKPEKLAEFSIPGEVTIGKTAPQTENVGNIPQKGGQAQILASQDKVEDISVACVACAIGHFSTSAGLLNEAMRFKKEGIASNEILDRIAKALEEQNALERVDLTPENIQTAKEWERPIAEKALEESRDLRHRLESIQNIEDLEQAAVDTEGYYRKLNREWYKGRFAHIGTEDKEKIKNRVKELIEEA